MKDRIIKIRKESGKTQDEFAEIMGISKNYVSLIENGKKVPGDRLISDICREFNVNEEWLRTGEGDMKENGNIEFGKICRQIGISDKKAQKAIIDYWNLSPDDKKLFWDFIGKFMK